MIVDVWGPLIELVKKLEGLVLTAYPSWEGGMDTIGYGHKMKAGDPRDITLEQAEGLLIKDLTRARSRALSYFTSSELFNMPPAIKALATELVFNVGSLRGYPQFRAKASGEVDGDPIDEIGRTYINRQGLRVTMTYRVNTIKDWYREINA